MSRTKGSKNRQNRSNQAGNHPAKAPAVKVIEQKVKEPDVKVIEVAEKATEAQKPIQIIEDIIDTKVDDSTDAKAPLKAADSATGPEATETIEEIKEPQFLDKFWFGNVFIPGVGVVSGRVRDDHYAIFLKKFESGQSKLPKADRLTLNINYWVRDTDELDKKLQEGKKQQA